MKRTICLITALSLFTPYVVYAADAAPIEAGAQDILFKNGGKARGQVVEIVPGDHVTVHFKNGETRRFDWKDVDRVVAASGPEPPALPPLAAPPTTAPTAATTAPATGVVAGPVDPEEAMPPVTGPTAVVHINSPQTTHLFRRAMGRQRYHRVCDSPCDVAVPIGDDYQVAVDGGNTTDIHLAAKEGQTVVIEVNPSSTGGKVGGIIMIVIGGITLLVGGITDLVGLALESTKSTTGTDNSADGVLIAGIVITAVGAGLIVGGIVVVVKSASTDINQHTAMLPWLPAASTADDRYVRTPVWHTPSVLDAPKNQAAMTIPIFSRSF